MSDQKQPWMAGLFAGIFSSASGTWIPMSQLRRFSSVGAWMLAFGMIAYGMFWSANKTGALKSLDICELSLLCIGAIGVAAGSFWLFLRIGGRKYGVEKDQD